VVLQIWKKIPTFGICWWRSLKMGGNVDKISMLDVLGYSINEFQELAPWFPLTIFTSRGVVLSGSNLFHELNAKCMHIFDQNFTQISMKIQGQIDHLKALKTSHAPPFLIFFLFTMAHIHLKFPKNHLWLMIVYKLICLQNKIILICFWVVNQSKRSITKRKNVCVIPFN